MPTTRSFRPRGLSPPRRVPPPAACGLVASHYRPWGSSGFRRRRSSLMIHRGFPADALPFRAFPTTTAVPASLQAVALSPLRAAFLAATRARSTSRLFSVGVSVVMVRRCRHSMPVALLGFPRSGASQSSSPLIAADRSRRPSPRHPLGGRRRSLLASTSADDNLPAGRCRVADVSRSQERGTSCTRRPESSRPPWGSSRPTDR